jgi:hypothetical protein
MRRRMVKRIITAGIVVIGVSSLPACSPEEMLDVHRIDPDSLARLEAKEAGVDRVFSVLPLMTPDGYNQTVHPDYAVMPDWKPHRYIVATPYAFSDTLVENPSLYAQREDLTWQTFGSGNPIAKPRAGYLSDPDAVSLADRGELWIYYREVTRRNTIWLIRSSNGTTWSAARRVVSAPNHMIVSPSVVRRDPTHWMMWSVNAGKAGCTGGSTYVELRTSSDGLRWSMPAAVPLIQEPFSVWHIDVQWIPSLSEYWALYNVKTEGSCNTQLLYLATSPDGVSWKTYPSPVLRIGAVPEFSDIVYRSTFAYSSRTDNIRFWFSGARYVDRGFVWKTVYQRRARAEVFAEISAPPPATRQNTPDGGRSSVPMMINPP